MTTEYPSPQAVFALFAEIAKIPHGSGNTAALSRYCVDFALKRGLSAVADAEGNVVIEKPASKGYETRPRVIVQGHLDMVCAKDETSAIDFEKEGLRLKFSNEFLEAEGTTLGADDGIAVAYALALLDAKDIPHPPLTVLLTVDEEIGMLGAAALSPKAIKGKYLLNLDSEEEGKFIVGCAGGVRVEASLTLRQRPTFGKVMTVTLGGLRGGHSGMEIHKPLLNANIGMMRLLTTAGSVRLSRWNGGEFDNAIPTESTAVLICRSSGEIAEIQERMNAELAKLRMEYPEEHGMTLEVVESPKTAASVLESTELAKMLSLLWEMPHGVIKKNEKLKMPDTSLNLGILRMQDGILHLDYLVRSGINAEKDALTAQMHSIIERNGGTWQQNGNYPAWEYQPNTELVQTAALCYGALFHEAPQVKVIHAGLECGVLAAKVQGMECISFGPEILEIHTPRERLSIASAERTWGLLLEILKHLGEPRV